MTGKCIFAGTLKTRWLLIIALLALGMLRPSLLSANTFYVRDDGTNRWPGIMVFHAPCGASLVSAGGTTYMAPPPTIDFSAVNNPANLCASLMRTLTDPDTTSVTTVGAVNPKYQTLPDGTAVPAVSSPTGARPQDPQNVPTPYLVVSSSGTMQFVIPINFRDDSDTMFEGKFDGVLESPYDATVCPSLPGVPTDPATGFAQSPAVPTLCQITTPTQYVAVVKQGHAVGWAEVSSATVMAYGPTDSVPPGTQAWQKQGVGSMVSGALVVPYATNNNSTVLRIALRYGTGFAGVAPLTWGNWPTPYCRSSNCLQPSDWAGMQTPWMPSQPFTVQIQPVYQVQFHILPAFILYQPPGNQSTSSISMNTTYTQNYQSDQVSTITDQNEYDYKTKQDLSFDPGWSYNGASESISFSQSTTWDNSTKNATRDQYALSVSSVVSQGLTSTYNTAKLDSTAVDVKDLTFHTEPFWSDQIYFAVNPQFAVWDYPKGQMLQPLGSSYITAFSVAQLANCVPRMWAQTPTGLPFNYDVLNPDNTTTHKQDGLSPFECTSLAALDPFYVGLSQATAPAMGISVPPGTQPLTTGVHTDQSTQVNSFNTKTSFNKTYDATVTSARQNTISVGGTMGLWGSKFSASSSITTGNTTANQVTMSLGTTQSATTQQTLTSTINLADCPMVSGKSSCNAPLSNPPNVQVFEDTRFGTMMGVLPDLNIPATAQQNGPAFGGPGTFTVAGGAHVLNGGPMISTGVAHYYGSLGITPLHANLNASDLIVNKPAIVLHAPHVNGALVGPGPRGPVPGVRTPGAPLAPQAAHAGATAVSVAPPIRVGLGQGSPLSAPDEAKISAKYPNVRGGSGARIDRTSFAKVMKLQKAANGKLIAVTSGPVGLGSAQPQPGTKPSLPAGRQPLPGNVRQP